MSRFGAAALLLDNGSLFIESDESTSGDSFSDGSDAGNNSNSKRRQSAQAATPSKHGHSQLIPSLLMREVERGASPHVRWHLIYRPSIASAGGVPPPVEEKRRWISRQRESMPQSRQWLDLASRRCQRP
jgi:hypothetical protein